MARRKNDESMGCAVIVAILIIFAIGKYLIEHPILIVVALVLAIACGMLWKALVTASKNPSATRATSGKPGRSADSAERAYRNDYGSAWSDEHGRASHGRRQHSSADRREHNLRIYNSEIPTVDLSPGATALLIDMDYIDRGGEETHRRVRVDALDVDAYGVMQFSGFCELRSDKRTFSTRGVLRIRSDRGVILRNHTPAFIRSEHLTTKFGRTERAIESSRTLVDILTHIARASGNISPSERRIIVSVILDSLGPHQPDENRIKTAVRESVMSPNQFRTALGMVARKGGTDLLILRSLVEDMASLKTSADPYTQAALQIARQHIGTATS